SLRAIERDRRRGREHAARVARELPRSPAGARRDRARDWLAAGKLGHRARRVRARRRHRSAPRLASLAARLETCDGFASGWPRSRSSRAAEKSTTAPTRVTTRAASPAVRTRT